MVVGSPIRVGPFPERISFDSANADLYVTNISTVTPSCANTPCAKTTTGLAPPGGSALDWLVGNNHESVQILCIIQCSQERLRRRFAFSCKKCKHKFLDNRNEFVKMRTPSHVIVAALSMYFDGLLVRKVSAQINIIYGEKSSQVTVWNWIQKYSKLLSEYIETLQPKLSGKYHHDETEVSGW